MSKERLPFSLAYFGSLALTLFFAIGVSRNLFPWDLTDGKLRTTIGTLVAAIIQVSVSHSKSRGSLMFRLALYCHISPRTSPVELRR